MGQILRTLPGCSPCKPGGLCIGCRSRVVSNLSFTAKFETTKPLKTLQFSGVLCFQRVKKGSYGNIHGNKALCPVPSESGCSGQSLLDRAASKCTATDRELEPVISPDASCVAETQKAGLHPSEEPSVIPRETS